MNTPKPEGAICMNVEGNAGRLTRMPNVPATTIRGIRIPDELWEDSMRIAKAEGYRGASEMVRDCLERRRAEYIEEHGAVPMRDVGTQE